MKKSVRDVVKRWIILMLVLALICPALPVQAEEVQMTASPDDVESGMEETQKTASPDGAENEAEEECTDGQEESLEVPSADDAAAESEDVENSGTEDIDQRLNYVYVESPYLETPGTQRIAVSWGDGTEGVESIELDVRKEDGSQETWQPEKREDHLYLFTKEFADSEQSGIYEITALTVKTADADRRFAMSELETEAFFGVDKEYDGMEELQPLDAEQMAEEDCVDISVATINEDGTTEEQNSIAEALDKANEDVSASVPGVMSAEGRAVSDEEEDIVVALDPGHDDLDAGAQGNGLKEEVLTLKIAKYCKEELEKYSGVEVYMTRTGAKCPYNAKTAGACIEKRVKAAAKAGAKIFVSFHLNASTASAAEGAEIIIPNNNWKPQVGKQGKALAEDILAELVKIGLKRREIYSKNSTIGEKYPDNSLSDYFSVQIYCKEQGIPGIIIEHAFITNKNEANKFLKTEAGLKKLGVADAKGIVKYLGLSKEDPNPPASLKTPVLVSAVNRKGGVTVTWKKVADAKGYYVYRKVPGGSWSKIGTVRSAGTVTFKDTAVSSGKTYSYTVQAYYGSLKSSRDNQGVTTMYLKTPALVSASAGSSSIKVTWKKVTAADGYYVYRKTSGGKWSQIASIKKNSTVSYTDKKASYGTTYYYTVRAYKNKTKSYYVTAGVSARIVKYIKYKTTDYVNYRSGPGLSYAVKGTLKKGKIVSVEKGYSKKSGGYTWYRLKLNSRTYYIASAYIKKK